MTLRTIAVLVCAWMPAGLAHAQFTASLSGSSGATLWCEASGSEPACRMSTGQGLAPGWYRVHAEGSGAPHDALVALRGIEVEIGVELDDGAIAIERVYEQPANITLTLGPHHDPQEAPGLLLYNATTASVLAFEPRHFLLAELGAWDPVGQGWRRLESHPWCGNALFGPQFVLPPGRAALVRTTYGTGPHEPIRPDRTYRIELCVRMEAGAWWESTTDPLALLPVASAAPSVDVVCLAGSWTGREILDARMPRGILPPVHW